MLFEGVGLVSFAIFDIVTAYQYIVGDKTWLFAIRTILSFFIVLMLSLRIREIHFSNNKNVNLASIISMTALASWAFIFTLCSWVEHVNM